MRLHDGAKEWLFTNAWLIRYRRGNAYRLLHVACTATSGAHTICFCWMLWPSQLWWLQISYACLQPLLVCLDGNVQPALCCPSQIAALKKLVWLQDVHGRMQPLLLFFVDAASVIDQEDGDWDLLLAVRQDQGHGHPEIVRPLPPQNLCLLCLSAAVSLSLTSTEQTRGTGTFCWLRSQTRAILKLFVQPCKPLSFPSNKSCNGCNGVPKFPDFHRHFFPPKSLSCQRCLGAIAPSHCFVVPCKLLLLPIAAAEQHKHALSDLGTHLQATAGQGQAA